MSVFRLYLWKEWREHRPAVLALAGMLPMLVLAITLRMHPRQADLPEFPAAAALLALIVTLLAIGGELLGSDRRAGGQWLERLPAGRSGAFPAKLLLLALTSVLALAYGFVLAQLGLLLRGRPVDSPLELVQRDPLLALAMLCAAAMFTIWTFAASAWSGRGTLALLTAGLVVGLMVFVVWYFAVRGYQASALEAVLVLALLSGSGLVSAWAGFTRGQRFGRSALQIAARGVPAGALCLLPLGGWALHQLHERGTIDLHSPGSRVDGAWVFENGRRALLLVSRESGRWDWRSVVRLDLERGTREVLGGTGAGIWSVMQCSEWEPTQGPDEVWIQGEAWEEPIVLDGETGEILLEASGEPPISVSEMGKWERAGHGFVIDCDTDPVLVDPYHDLRVRPEDIGIEVRFGVYIGPSAWLVDSGATWFTYSPECAELERADWMEPFGDVGPMLADGRLLVHVGEEDSWALADPVTRTLVRLVGPESGLSWPRFLQSHGLRPGEPALVDTAIGRCRLDEEALALVPVDDSYAGDFVRALDDGTLFFLTDEGLFRRHPDGLRTCVFSFADAVQEVAP